MKSKPARPTPFQTLRSWVMFLLAPAGVYFGTRSALAELRLAVDTFAPATWWTCAQHVSMVAFYLSIPWAYVVAWWRAVNVLWWEDPPRPRAGVRRIGPRRYITPRRLSPKERAEVASAQKAGDPF